MRVGCTISFLAKERWHQEGPVTICISPEMHVHTYICYMYSKHLNFFLKIKIFVLQLPLPLPRCALLAVRAGAPSAMCSAHSRAFN